MIRPLTLSDYDGLAALWRSCPGVGLRAVDDSREGIQRLLQRNPDTCFGAEEDGALVGALLCGSDGRRGYLYHLAVRPDCRRRGMGRALTDAALSALRDLGITKVSLAVFRENEAGNAFWDALGFPVREDLLHREFVLDPENR